MESQSDSYSLHHMANFKQKNEIIIHFLWPKLLPLISKCVKRYVFLYCTHLLAQPVNMTKCILKSI